MQEALFAQRPSQGSQTFTKLPLFYEFPRVLMTARNLRMLYTDWTINNSAMHKP
jgi:hypothetical protein